MSLAGVRNVACCLTWKRKRRGVGKTETVDSELISGCWFSLFRCGEMPSSCALEISEHLKYINMGRRGVGKRAQGKRAQAIEKRRCQRGIAKAHIHLFRIRHHAKVSAARRIVADRAIVDSKIIHEDIF